MRAFVLGSNKQYPSLSRLKNKLMERQGIKSRELVQHPDQRGGCVVVDRDVQTTKTCGF